MSVRGGARQIFSVIDLEDGKPDFLPFVALWVEVEIGYLPHSRFVVYSDLKRVFGIALKGSRRGSVEVNGRCSMRTGRMDYSAHCACVTCVEASTQQVSQEFRDIIAGDEVVTIGKILICSEIPGQRTTTQSSFSLQRRSWLCKLWRA